MTAVCFVRSVSLRWWPLFLGWGEKSVFEIVFVGLSNTFLCVKSSITCSSLRASVTVAYRCQINYSEKPILPLSHPSISRISYNFRLNHRLSAVGDGATLQDNDIVYITYVPYESVRYGCRNRLSPLDSIETIIIIIILIV